MKSNLYPKYNILLIDGSTFFDEAFTCFLDHIYSLNLHTTNLDQEIYITPSADVIDILHSCLLHIHTDIKESKKFINTHKIYCNIVLYFNLQDLEQTQEIFKYFNKTFIFKHINVFLKSLNKKKINYYICKNNEKINFTSNFSTIITTTGKIQETLNIINFNLL